MWVESGSINGYACHITKFNLLMYYEIIVYQHLGQQFGNLDISHHRASKALVSLCICTDSHRLVRAFATCIHRVCVSRSRLRPNVRHLAHCISSAWTVIRGIYAYVINNSISCDIYINIYIYIYISMLQPPRGWVLD